MRIRKIYRHKTVFTSLLLSCFLGWISLAAIADDSQASKGYSELMDDKLPSAETTFQKMASSTNADTALKGEEGLAEVEIRRGKIIEASMRIDKVVKKAPKRTKARTIKAKILYKQGKKREAESELGYAENGNSDFSWQKAEAHTLKGNIYRNRKESSLALAAYKKALTEEPTDRDALSNMGVTLQELGQPEEAIKAFSQLKQSHPNDRLGDALLRQAQAAIAQKQDLEKQHYINDLVKELVDRYKNQSQDKPEDDWTTPAMALSIIGFADNNVDNLAERAGLDIVLQNELTNQLQAAHLKVVERAILDKVVSELNLGSSNLSDPDTALKLGKIIAARLIATGSVSAMGADKMVNLRLIDTETTDIVLPLSERQGGNPDPASLAAKFTQAITSAVKDKYPMKGRIAEAEGGTVIINLGNKHNVTNGMVFNVLGEDEEPIELNGKILGTRQTKVGQLKVSKVEDLMSYAQPVAVSGSLEKSQKIIQAQ
jgi:tetratricopeptide (TPR) repeat protein